MSDILGQSGEFPIKAGVWYEVECPPGEHLTKIIYSSIDCFTPQPEGSCLILHTCEGLPEPTNGLFFCVAMLAALKRRRTR